MKKPDRRKHLLIRTTLVWVGIILLGAFWLTIRGSLAPVSITVVPESPRPDEPVLVTFKLNNPHPGRPVLTDYQFYVDGKLLKEGQAAVDPLSSKTYQYAFASPVAVGERVTFTVKAASGGEHYERSVSIPPFPPQVCSSFISFASFSATVMSSLATSPYYRENFAASTGLNAGLVISLCLILLLIALELAGAATGEDANFSSGPPAGTLAVLQRFKVKFNTLTWILFIIFIGIVYTKIVIILSMT